MQMHAYNNHTNTQITANTEKNDKNH